MVASLGAGSARGRARESLIWWEPQVSAAVRTSAGRRLHVRRVQDKHLWDLHFSCSVSAPSLIEMYNVKNIAAHGAMRHSTAVMKVSSAQAMFINLY